MSDSHEYLVRVRSSAFPNVCLRLDGSGVTTLGPGGGKVNCQFGAQAMETFNLRSNPDGTASFESYAFRGVFLRMNNYGINNFDVQGAGEVNGQFGAQAMESFKLVKHDDETQSILSTLAGTTEVALRMDGTGVTHFAPAGAGTVNLKPTGAGIGDWEKFSICACTSHTQCMKAIDQFIDWFPEEIPNIMAHSNALICTCCPPFSLTPEQQAAVLKVRCAAMTTAPTSDIDPKKIPSCLFSVGAVVFDVVSLALSLVGLGGMVGRIYKRLGYEIIGDAVRPLKTLIYDIWGLLKSSEWLAATKKIFTLLGQIWNVGLFRMIWNYLKHEMSWWDWISSGVIAVAQIIAWLATEGIAFIAECVLLIPSAVSLIKNCLECVTACGSTA